MKLFLQGTTILALLIANASATKSGIFVANGVELEMYQSGEDIIYGEPQSMVEARGLEGRACTKCVGHHGSCVVGEGNCYPPDMCGFCGGCSVNQARCQNPKKEGCQCYK
ncbi:unnamed protein product [Penicillium nalgiovense]|uniref:Uncharacterized protein n=1 Tax=Penicillium nalgiovense TaxID=60175 RepID=A0A1V6YJT1_PENNA|nr:hypothetical protein PENNAL_c0019G02187 [Penicillium nalgiovense]CAG8176728.1 unnamed protein product [Penicillium nalgiovense]CAG8183536.1 unnamed protein product [Penicillium nalgiovense]CAG8189080.1 unnamed protein product [Penicillium nalgiovense]CAG8189235.1 unnamed protein product [Penicillium nalgiovense]